MGEPYVEPQSFNNHRELQRYLPQITRVQFLVPLISKKRIRTQAGNLLIRFSRRRHYFFGRSWQGTRYVGNVRDTASLSWTRWPHIQGNNLEQLHRLIGNAARTCYVDVGANGGLYCSNIGRLILGRGAVIGLEADPDLASLAAASAAVNSLDNVRIFPLAVGDRAGELVFHTVPARSTSSSVLYDHLLKECGGDTAGIRSISVHCIRLDDLLPTLPEIQSANHIVLKVDVEGHEMSVFRGAAEFIRTRQPIIFFEWNKDCVTPDRASLKAMTDFLAALAPYRFSAVHEAGGNIPFPPPAEESPLNIIAQI